MLDGKALGLAGSRSAARYASSASDHDSQGAPGARRTMSTRPRPSTSEWAGLDRAREVTVVLPVVAGRNALVDEYLRQKLQVGRQFGKGSCRCGAWRKHLKGAPRCRRPSSGGRAQECGRRFAAEKPAVALGLLEHSGRRPWRARRRRRVRRSGARGRSWSSACRQRPRLGLQHAVAHDHVEEFVTVVDVALGVRHDQAVRVAVEAHRDVAAVLGGKAREVLGVGRAHAVVDVEAVWCLPTATTSAPSSWKTSGAM